MRRTIVVLTVLVALATTGCRDDHVTIAYRPLARRDVRVRDPCRVIDNELVCGPTAHVTARRRTRRLHRAPPGSRRVGRHDARRGAPRTGRRRRTNVHHAFDRAAQLTAVESVEGMPAEALGTLGLSEIFPAAAGAPPDRPLRPGEPLGDRRSRAARGDGCAHSVDRDRSPGAARRGRRPQDGDRVIHHEAAPDVDEHDGGWRADADGGADHDDHRRLRPGRRLSAPLDGRDDRSVRCAARPARRRAGRAYRRQADRAAALRNRRTA